MEERQIVEQLAAREAISLKPMGDRQCLQLTALGLRLLHVTYQLKTNLAVALLQVRDNLPREKVGELTTYELLKLLQSAGWQLHILPSSAGARQRLPQKPVPFRKASPAESETSEKIFWVIHRGKVPSITPSCR